MEMQFNAMLDQVTDFMKTEANTKTVIGEVFALGEFQCIPVVRIGLGFGTGGREEDLPKKGHDEGAGLGAGMGIAPIGFLVSKGDNISFISTTTNKGLSAAFEKVPHLIEKFMENRKLEEAMV